MATTKPVTIEDNADPFQCTDTDAVYAPLWWHSRGLSQTTSGYGARLTTAWRVQYRGRLRRVYCTIYSNIGTCWIVVNRKKVGVR